MAGIAEATPAWKVVSHKTTRNGPAARHESGQHTGIACGGRRGGRPLILVDANILLYAEDQLSTFHKQARSWWDEQLSQTSPVCLCWSVLKAYLRISTNRRVFQRPLSLDEAITRTASWFSQPCIRLIAPTDRHWEVLQRMLREGQALANLVSDAHLAALAVEHGCVLCSTDADFARFPSVKWRNPLG